MCDVTCPTNTAESRFSLTEIIQENGFKEYFVIMMCMGRFLPPSVHKSSKLNPAGALELKVYYVVLKVTAGLATEELYLCVSVGLMIHGEPHSLTLDPS